MIQDFLLETFPIHEQIAALKAQQSGAMLLLHYMHSVCSSENKFPYPFLFAANKRKSAISVYCKQAEVAVFVSFVFSLRNSRSMETWRWRHRNMETWAWNLRFRKKINK
jgi:hypothetical protein